MAMDPIRLYLKDIKNIPLLTPEEELKVSKRAKRGDAAARKLMIRSNLRLVVNIAKKYSFLGVPITDLIEEGNMGLMRSVQKFDPKKGYRFSTYAAWWIRQYITRAIANQSKTIRVPVYLTETITKWKRITERLSQQYGRTPTIKEIAKKMRVPIKKARRLSEIVTRTTSLHKPIGEDSSGEFMDLIEDESVVSPFDELSRLLRQEKIAELLEKMSEREKQILILRYGLEDGTFRTLEETAKEFKISRERVRQIENNALKKLRVYMKESD
ncbi:MAG: sigma-70 family RNA polymerase sigma factor [Candidatus Omnitrophica bacterium]|nr:sigma-70 family RNA polymerase sigma factor [Candidatus Omnitrophota bacterium]